MDPDVFSYHELMDRASSVRTIFETLVIEHPVTDDHPEFKQLCQEAMDKLQVVYQAAADLPGNKPPELQG
jgi:hypothetical protein